MIAHPGAGLTMLAKGLPAIITPLTLEEAPETTKIHSVARKIYNHAGLITKRPFRSQHHSITDIVVIKNGVESYMSSTPTILVI